MPERQPSFQFGIEEEYHLVDRATREAVPVPVSMLTACESALGTQVCPEFLQSQIEVATRPMSSFKAARTELAQLRRTLADVAATYGLAPIAAASHPFTIASRIPLTERERYHAIARDLGAVSWRMAVCGMHVHVSLPDDDLRIDIMNQVRYFLPHLLLLSTSSPFWEGKDTGLKSFRIAANEECPRSGLPSALASWAEYQSVIDVLVSAGVIRDASKVWWDVRPSARFPTLELRIPDVCPRIDDALAIAALYVAIVRMLTRRRASNPSWLSYPQMLIEENRWRAQRYGVAGTLFDFQMRTLVPAKDLMAELLKLVTEDGQALGCQEELARVTRITEEGTSADRQLARLGSSLEAGLPKEDALRLVVDDLIAETVADL